MPPTSRHMLHTIFTFSRPIKIDIPNTITKKKTKPTLKAFDRLNGLQKKALIAFEEKLMVERKAWSTIRSYKFHLMGLFFAYSNIKPSQITAQQIERHLLQLIQKKKIAISTHNQVINSLSEEN